MASGNEDWLSRYANGAHAWKQATVDGKPAFHRRIGVVESAFDVDGTDFGGRADVHALLTVEIQSSLSTAEFKRRMVLVWTNMRLHHVMLMTRAFRPAGSEDRHFLFDVPGSDEEAIAAAARSVDFLQDRFESVDGRDFVRHAQNSARVVDAAVCHSRLFILPPRPLTDRADGRAELQVLVVAAHSTTDGLSMQNWIDHFVQLLNEPLAALEAGIAAARAPAALAARLPVAQEDLYPPIPGSRARQRWFWAILRVLRHVKRPFPPSIPNPLRRPTPLPSAILPQPTYAPYLDYSPARAPPLNTYSAHATLSPQHSALLAALCRQTGVSIGAGIFTLVALSLMQEEEALHPATPPDQRKPITLFYPLNPLPFLTRPPGSSPALTNNSCTLAFSPGLTLPHLPSDLPLPGRFRLLARLAQRQLRLHQKRSPKHPSSSSPSQQQPKQQPTHTPLHLLATTYLSTLERLELRRPPHRRSHTLLTHLNPPAYPPTPNPPATCGVSSLGRAPSLLTATAPINPGFAAVFRALDLGVRAREGEFLVAAAGREDVEGRVTMGFGVSFDGCAVEEGRVRGWEGRVEGLLKECEGEGRGMGEGEEGRGREAGAKL